MPNIITLLKNVALRRIVVTLVRHGLTALGIYLTSRGYASDADWSSVALDLSPLLVSLVWSVLEKSVADKREDVALDMAPGSTKRDVTAAINAGA